jgi:predicted DNA-binding transcriptional regulator YafY
MRLLPKAPARKSVSQILDEITAQGFEVDRRTLQRDLKSLANLFPIESDGNKDIPGWFWRKDAEKLELPEMEPSVALTFRMVKLFLEKFMPPTTLHELQPYFDYSDKVLSHLPHNHLTNWDAKVSLLSRSQPLLSPEVGEEVLSTIYQALLSDQQFKAHYQPRGEEPRDYVINPLGIVAVDQVLYLVGTLWDYQDVKQFAIHRFKSVELLDEPAKEVPEFSLRDYIRAGHFEYLVNDEADMISLKLKINAGLYIHLSESRLSEDQVIKKECEDFILTATVKNTQQLRWWLMGLGLGVEVLEPQNLRKELADSYFQLNQRYR